MEQLYACVHSGKGIKAYWKKRRFLLVPETTAKFHKKLRKVQATSRVSHNNLYFEEDPLLIHTVKAFFSRKMQLYQRFSFDRVL